MSAQLGVEIVTRVAKAENTGPIELTPSLGDVIDVDALEAILESPQDGITVEFEYHDWMVEARDDSTIKIRGSVDAD